MSRSPSRKQLRFESPGGSPLRRAHSPPPPPLQLQPQPQPPPPRPQQEQRPTERELCNSPTWDAWSQSSGKSRRFSWFRRSSISSNDNERPKQEILDTREATARPAKLKKSPPTAMSTQKSSIRMFSLKRFPSRSSRRMSQSSLESTGSQAISISSDAPENLEPALRSPELDKSRGEGTPDTAPTSGSDSPSPLPSPRANFYKGDSPNDRVASPNGKPKRREFPIAPLDLKPTVPRRSEKRVSNDSIPLETEQFNSTDDSEANAKALAEGLTPSPLFYQPTPIGPGVRRSSEVRSRRDSRADQSPISPAHQGFGSLEFIMKDFLECCRCRRFFEAPPEFYLALEYDCRTVREVRRVAKERGIEFKEQNIKWHFAIRSDGRLRIYCFWCHHAMRRVCCELWHTGLGKMDRQWHPLRDA